MQKTKSNLAALSIIMCATLFSCGENAKQKKSEASLTQPVAAGMIANAGDCTIDSFYLPKPDAVAMMATFDSVFQVKERGLQNSFWFDTCVISGFARLLQTGNYDGVRFYNAARSKDGNGAGNPAFLIMAPTIRGENIWGKTLNTSDKCSTDPASFNIEQKDAYNLVYNFGYAYRMESRYGDHSSAKNDSLSIAVWINKCVFEMMATAINDPENKIDGFRIYAGAYDKTKQAPAQKYGHQSTVFIVPTNDDGAGGHADNWNIFTPAYGKVQQKSAEGDGTGGGLNHNDLCPYDCPNENP